MSTSRIGRYEIVRPLGRGAMGLVYLARDPQIEREVALKTVRFDGPGSSFNVEESKARFLKEARISGRLQHPHIVTVFDVGEDQGTLYLAMEYVSGGSLSQRLGKGEKGEPLELDDRIRIVCEVAAGLAHAHERGVIHRDVKPANILLTESLAAKVTDFGIGKLIVGDTDLTSTGQMVGSPSYMSPEQIRGEKLDVRSDIFSLGVVLYQTLTERKPFPADTLTTLVYQILHEEPPDPSVLRSSLPAGISSIVKRCLAKDRNERYSNAGELADELAAVLGLPADGGTVGLSESVARKRFRPSSTQPPVAAPKPSETSRKEDVPTVSSGERPTPAAPPEPPPGASAPDETLVSASHAGVTPAPAPEPGRVEASGAAAAPAVALSASQAGAQPAKAAAPPARPAAPERSTGRGPIIAIAALVVAALAFFALKGKKTAVDVPPPVPAVRRTPSVPSPVASPASAPTALPAVVAETPTAAPEPTAEPTKKAVVARPKVTATPARAAATPTAAAATATPIPSLAYATKRFVKLDMSPSQARVFLDGHPIGIVDDWDDAGGGALLVFMKEGRHQIRLAYPEYRDVLIDLNVSSSASSDTAVVKGSMQKGPSESWSGPAGNLKRPDYRTIGPIRFNVEPKDSVVEVDGLYRGPVASYTSQDLLLTDLGVFDVKISAPGYGTKIVRLLVAQSAGEARATIKEKLKVAK